MTKVHTHSRRKKASLRRPTIGSFVAALVIGGTLLAHSLNGCSSPEPQMPSASQTYGNLMEVVTNPTVPSQFKSYTGMDLSFNAKCHIPNWVSWELTSEETTGEVSRTNTFYNDPEIDGCPDTSDYSYSGYDRGHMAPAGDMKWSKQAMDDTFFLSNICPQAKQLNTGSWKNLEEKCRTWAQIDGKIYIVCGPIIDEKPMELIGDSKVWVPSRFFKVIIAPYSTPARGIGFIMSNGKVEGGMQVCAVTIDEVERITGHDFFSSLPDELENDLESQCNFNQWSTLRK